MAKKEHNGVLWMLIFILITFSILLLMLSREEATKDDQEEGLPTLERCITKANVTLYGKSNSQTILAQKEALGNVFETITFIDCSLEREKCEGIMLVPAWNIKNQVYYGSFSKDVLIKLVGCENEL